MGKINYLKRILISQFQTHVCPCCNSKKYNLIDSKYFGITKLLECKSCKLRYRIPQDSKEYNFKFYQSSYEQGGLTTDLPRDKELLELKNTNFSNSEKDFSYINPLLKSISNYLGRKLKILDYGANWGYFAFQIKKLDFVESVKCYELSLPRRKFGEAKLGIEYIEKPPEKDMRFDLLFSSHVIEHMQNPIILRDWIIKSLKDDGISVITCPNGSDSAKFNKNWSQLWGEVHPNFISDRFLCKNFSDFKGTIFDESLLSEKDLASKLCIKEISSMLPESPNLWFIAQKIN